MRCLLVDDESLARDRFRALLHDAGHPGMEIIGEAESGQKAIPMMYELKPDCVFLDIQMPGLSGFDVVDLLARPRPHIVFVTAYDDYALKAFEVHALDYLTKPVRLDRLQRCLRRIDEMLRGQGGQTSADANIESLRQERASLMLTRLTLHAGNRLRVVNVQDIERIEAEDKIVHVFLREGRFRTDFTLDELEARLDKTLFVRIHRSHIVRIDAIKELIPWFSGSYCVKVSDGTQLPVARRRAQDVKALLGKA
jgi:two-component system LytT family response regulator